MTQKILLFFAFPFFVFGTIEIAKPPTPTKVEEKSQPSPTTEAPQGVQNSNSSEDIDDSDDNLLSPKGSNPHFLDPNYNQQFFKILIFICLLIIFAMIIIFIYRRSTPIGSITKKNSRNNIKILERRSLSPQTYLYHIQVGNKQFILSESKVETRTVATMDWPEN
jgi:hypothetical protein